MTPVTITPEEQAANRAKWYEALESGAYKQCVGSLRAPNGAGYCCLGVAADVFRGSREWTPGNWGFVIDEKDTRLPDFACEALGLDLNGDFPNGVVLLMRGQAVDCLWKLNDRGRATFSEIAAIAKWLWDGGPKPEGVEVVS